MALLASPDVRVRGRAFLAERVGFSAAKRSLETLKTRIEFKHTLQRMTVI